jgi:hypothetical protein
MHFAIEPRSEASVDAVTNVSHLNACFTQFDAVTKIGGHRWGYFHYRVLGAIFLNASLASVFLGRKLIVLWKASAP